MLSKGVPAPATTIAPFTFGLIAACKVILFGVYPKTEATIFALSPGVPTGSKL